MVAQIYTGEVVFLKSMDEANASIAPSMASVTLLGKKLAVKLSSGK